MTAINIQHIKNHTIISFPDSAIDSTVLLQMFSLMRLEELVKKGNFPSEIEEISEEIKQSWWHQNREKYLAGVL
jgi:hypothetical protein